MNEQEPLIQNYSKFDIKLDDIHNMICDKSREKLDEFGGVEGLLKTLKTDKSGLPLEVKDKASRIDQFGENKLEEAIQKSIWELIIEAYQDKILIAAVVSLIMGIYEDSKKKAGETKVGWVEGFAIIVAVLVVILTNAINDYQKESQFRKLNAKKEDRRVKVTRGGAEIEISIFDLLVGDIFLLENGEIVPVDGVIFQGTKLVIDESSATGESDTIKKDLDKDCFILSGTMVQEGVGKMVVVAVGKYSFNGRILMAMRKTTNEDGEEEDDSTPLQLKLDVLAEQIAKLGMASAFLMLVTLTVKFWVEKAISGEAPKFSEAVSVMVSILIQAITIVVVAVPEGLPMAVTLALAYATTKMIKDNNLVRVLSACETMGNVTIVCSDKTGTLTQNKMTVVSAVISETVFEPSDSSHSSTNENGTHLDAFKTKLESKKVLDLLNQAIATNSTAFEGLTDKGATEFVGSKTECALLNWGKNMGLDYKNLRNKFSPVKSFPFSSKNKSMGVLIQDGNNKVLHIKGASEIILEGCSKYLNLEGNEVQITSDIKHQFETTIQRFAFDALRTISLAYKNNPELSEAEGENDQPPISDLVLIGIVGIEDPLREGVVDSVRKFRRSGVDVKMITGDNILTAKAIAKKAGIFLKGGVAITGPDWRRLSEEEQLRLAPKMQVLARSSPEDKQTVVKILHKLNETVAMTGDGTNDGPALKMADVGFSMGIAGTEVAKEASSIILMDDNFNSLISALKWGRTINAGVRKFLQFQLSVNITAVVLAFFSSLFSNEGKSILTATQLLWVNLIMDTFAALALATEPPNEDVLADSPVPKDASLITKCMWKHIFAQSIFQILLNAALITPFGASVLHVFKPKSKYGLEVLGTCVFNVFVWCQIFNMINCRRIKDELNVFSNIQNHPVFLLIQTLIIFGQILIVNYGGAAFNTVPLTFYQWSMTVLIGFLSLPIGLFIRSIPVSIHEEQVKKPSQTRGHMLWDESIRDVKTQLKIYNALRRKPRRNTNSSSISRSSIHYE